VRDFDALLIIYIFRYFIEATNIGLVINFAIIAAKYSGMLKWRTATHKKKCVFKITKRYAHISIPFMRVNDKLL